MGYRGSWSADDRLQQSESAWREMGAPFSETSEKLEGTRAGPPTAFVESVEDALDHLYDFTRLNTHGLTRWLLPTNLPRGVSHAQALRQRLVDAIESMNPGGRLASSSRQKRAYHLLELRYVEATSFRD